MKRVLTGVAYNQAADRYSVPLPASPELLAVALGEDVRAKLEGETPRNGAHLRDVIVSVAIGFRATR
jgi:hypothetical protein